MRTILFPAALLLATALAGCGNGAPEADPEPTTADSSAAMMGMDGMDHSEGMAGSQMGGMMEKMRAHMQQSEGASAQEFMSGLPQHRQMLANMIAQMNREMREMDMTGDESWTSTVDALRSDLARLPEMTVEELEGFLPGHRQRITSLMEMHRAMMANMQM